jgi:beta-lactamase class A
VQIRRIGGRSSTARGALPARPRERIARGKETAMPVLMSRRAALAASLLAGSAFGIPRAMAQGGDAEALARLGELERRHGGRLGVAVLDTATGRRLAHRGDERFAMASTFKFLAAAFVLARCDRGEERLERRIAYGQRDLVTYSPTTEKHVGERGMTVAELCEAAITLSDNTAGNLVLASFGGPAGLTSFVRSISDPVTRLDRNEPMLNEGTPGDPRDTTTPAAMLETMRTLLVGEALSPTSREQLIAWLVASKTGDQRLRAGVPQGWRVGDKTGTGAHGIANDIAVMWPPGRGPILVAAYYAESEASDAQRSAVLADVGRIVAGA